MKGTFLAPGPRPKQKTSFGVIRNVLFCYDFIDNHRARRCYEKRGKMEKPAILLKDSQNSVVDSVFSIVYYNIR